MERPRDLGRISISAVNKQKQNLAAAPTGRTFSLAQHLFLKGVAGLCFSASSLEQRGPLS